MSVSRIRAKWTSGRGGDRPALIFESLEGRTYLDAAIWDGGPSGLGTNWHDPVNWVNDVLPSDGDEVTIDAGPAVEFSQGILGLSSLQSARPLLLRGGVLSVDDTSTVTDQVTLDGGTLGGGPWLLLGPGLSATDDPDSTLQGATISGDISLTQSNAFIRITGGLTVNGLVSMFASGARLEFDGGVQSFGGNADVLFAGFSGFRRVSAAAGAILTIESTVSFTGERGKIDSAGGSGSVVNLGTIWADISFGTIDVEPAILTNLGTLRATGEGVLRIAAGMWTNTGVLSVNQGTLRLGGSWDITQGIGLFSRNGGEVFIDGTLLNSNSTLTLGPATGTWRFGSGQIVGGTVELTGGATLAPYSQISGRLAQLTLNGNLSWLISLYTLELDGVTVNGNLEFSGFSTVVVKNGLTLNGTLTISGTDTQVKFTSAAQSISGAASILLRNEEAYFWAFEPLTIPANVSVAGYGRMFGTIINLGQVVADTNSRTLTIAQGSFQNDGAVLVQNGSTLNLGQVTAGPAAFVNTGTVTASGASTIRVGPSSTSGPVTLTNSGLISMQSGSLMNVGAQFVFNTITLNNTGTLEADGGFINIGSDLAMLPVIFNNPGLARARSGGDISIITPLTTAQLGDVRADGGTVTLTGFLDNANDVMEMTVTSGTWNISGALISGGVISLAGGGLLFDAHPANTLEGVTIQGDLNLSQTDAKLRVVDGLTVNGSLTVSGIGASVSFDGGSQTIDGVGSITLAGATGTQSLSADNDATVTIGADVTVRGISGDGRIGSTGAGSWVNQGTLSGKLLVVAPLNNAGIVEARDGLTLSIQSSVTNYDAGTLTGGSWRILDGSSLDFGPGQIKFNHANVSLTGSTALFAALNGLVTNSGSLALAGGSALNLTGGLLNSGTLEVGPGSTLTVAGTFTQSLAATLKLKYDAGQSPSITAVKGIVTGSVHVSWLNGYVPASGTLPAFLTASEVVGRFKPMRAHPAISAVQAALVYSHTSVAIQVSPGFNGRR